MRGTPAFSNWMTPCCAPTEQMALSASIGTSMLMRRAQSGPGVREENVLEFEAMHCNMNSISVLNLQRELEKSSFYIFRKVKKMADS